MVQELLVLIEETGLSPILLLPPTPMRRGLSKTFRSNLVEFDTDRGVRYAAPPTLWVRLYLIWTFRNFRSLPKQVFNRHQQRLIDKLIRYSTIATESPVDRSTLIGTVEQVRLAPQAVAELEAAPKAVPDNAGSPPSRTITAGINRGREEAPAQIRSQTTDPLKSETTTPKFGKPKVKIIVRVKKRNASLAFLAAAVLIAALLLPNRIHFRVGRSHTNTSSIAPAKAPLMPSQIQDVAMAAPTARFSNFAEKPSLPAVQLGSSAHLDRDRQLAPPGSLSNAALNLGPVSLASLLTPTAVPQVEPTTSAIVGDWQTGRTLPHLAGPPQSRMVYPAYPGTEQNGKVVLTAVVGQDGAVRSATVISGTKIFANAALKAVKQWRYLPYEVAGKPVEFQTTVAFDFRGDEVVSISFPQL